jgi:hypothetical protein
MDYEQVDVPFVIPPVPGSDRGKDQKHSDATHQQ